MMIPRLRAVAGGLATLAVVASGGLALAQPIILPSVVATHPATFTPNVESDAVVGHPAVYALKQLGSTMFAGGTFHTVDDANRANPVTRTNLFSFDATLGAISSFAPNIDGSVWAIETDPATNSVWVGGFFKNVNGVSRNGIAKFNATTGVLDPTFKSTAVAGPVTEIRLVNGRLIVGGNFSNKLVALNPSTGANTGYINLSITGQVSSSAGTTKVYRFAVNPAGTRLVGVGNFTSIGGQHRYRAFMLDLPTSGSATVDPWYYQPLDNMCAAASLAAYLRDVDFSSDGSWFVIDATGYVPQTGGVGRDICDAAARFETDIKSPTRPTWINYTGGDTLHSVAISGSVVYVQGHQRYLDNPLGRDFCGTGCAPRPGIGAIDATSGKALSWNPTKTRGVGGKDLLVTPAGLWVASDGAQYNYKYHHGIAFAPEQ